MGLPNSTLLLAPSNDIVPLMAGRVVPRPPPVLPIRSASKLTLEPTNVVFSTAATAAAAAAAAAAMDGFLEGPVMAGKVRSWSLTLTEAWCLRGLWMGVAWADWTRLIKLGRGLRA